MQTQHVAFRSKIERENEVDLLRNYRAIGIAAIAAASQAGRTEKKPVDAYRAANLNHARD